jgi:arylsulfatase
MKKPNVLIILTDQLRYDALSMYGNSIVHSPHLEKLASEGIVCEKAYSPCPVCVPARYCIRTGREPLTTGYFQNEMPVYGDRQSSSTEDRCGTFLARTMRSLGYRTFGIGKFHTIPVEEDIGYDEYLRCEEMDGYPDAFAQHIWSHPAYRHIEQLHGERTDMYYMPQTSPLPANLTAEHWAASESIRNIKKLDDRPFFGVVSFVGPHPPFAPPVPYNRMYDPDTMPDPIVGPQEIDHMDPRVAWNKYFVYAESIDAARFRTLKARYYGEITYIDSCIGRILDVLDETGKASNTLVVFSADHGEFLGDHDAVQKENFFEQSCHVPLLVRWPEKIPSGGRLQDLVSLVDVFGLATSAAGGVQLRDGIDLLGILTDSNTKVTNIGKRKILFGYSSTPGTLDFRMMGFDGIWKYIFHANGGGELLFNLACDPQEHINCINTHPEIGANMRTACIEKLQHPGGCAGVCNHDFKIFPRKTLDLQRCIQMNTYRHVHGFPKRPVETVGMEILES